MANCQARVVSCCPAILHLLFFFILSKQRERERERERERRERFKSNFWKGMTKTNVCCYVVPETQSSSSLIKQAQRVFLQVDAAVLHLHKHSSCMPVASSSKPSRTTLTQLPRPQYVMKLGYCQCCFLQSDEQKKGQMHGLWTTKSTTRTQRRYSCYSQFHAKEWFSDRSPVWRSLLCMKLTVTEKTSLCVCVVRFRMLSELLHIEHSFGKGGQIFFIWLIMNYMCLTQMSFFSHLPLFLSHFCYQTDYKKENPIEVWTMDVQLLRINFSFENKIHANFNIILSFPKLSG